MKESFRKQLKPFVKIVNDDGTGDMDIYELLTTAPQGYKLIYAIALSLAKWSQPAKNIIGCSENCGLCLYDYLCSSLADDCDKCILAKTEALECGRYHNSYWRQWCDAKNKEDEIIIH